MKLKGELLPEEDVGPCWDHRLMKTSKFTEDIGKDCKSLPLMVSEE